VSFMDTAMGDEDISRDEFYRAVQGLATAMDSGFAQINARLDRLNSKTEKHGNDIVRLETMVEEREKASSKDPAARWGAAGGVVAGVLAALWQWLGKP
jgi:hypothetical protein